MSDTEVQTGVTIKVDGQDVVADRGELVIDAAERAGVFIPRFCYHPRMKPVGMCRQCLVEIDTGRGPALQPSCMIECSDGMTVETGTPVAIKAQTGVLELLLVNHPLDCPVCDKGGECPLQDQAMSHGPGESRMVEEKRHFEKPIPVSDLVLLDRERCILCDRCTRFAKEVAGEPLIHFLDRGNQTQVNTFPDHPFASYYSGNTVQICPVGALTSSSYRFKARPWDLVQVESTCQGCAMGCRTVVDESRNRVLRQNGVDVDPVNWGWLCDKGRFGFEAIESDDRLGAPLVRDADGELVETTWADAIRKAATALKDARNKGGAGAIAVLGGARLTNEDAYAWAKLAKGVIGTDNVDAQMGDGLPADVVLGLPRATIDGLCAPGGTVLWVGPDPREELAVLYLRLRHAVVNDGVRLVAVTPTATSLDGLAAASFHPAPGDLPALVAALLDGGPTPDGADADALATARDLLAGDITVGLGRGSVAEAAGYTVDAAAVVARSRPDARVLPLLRRANVNGALDMGLAPGLLPGRTTLDGGRDRLGVVWSKVPAEPGLDATGILQAAADGKIDALVLLGADPLADFPDRELAAAALAGARSLVAVDLFLTESSSRADVVLAAAGPNEVAGTHTNVEGRISVLGQAVTPPGTARPAWMVAAEVAIRLGADLGLESVADIWAEIEAVAPSHAGITAELLAATGDGVVAPLPAAPLETTEVTDEGVVAPEDADAIAPDEDAPDTEPDADDTELPEASGEEAAGGDAPAIDLAKGDVDDAAGDGADPIEDGIVFVAPDPTPVPPVDSYALRLVVGRTMYDDGTLTQAAPALAGLAAEAPLRVHPAVLERLGVPDGTRVRAISPRATVEIPVVADAGVPRGVAAVALRRRSGGVGDLVDVGQDVTEVRVETDVSASILAGYIGDPLFFDDVTGGDVLVVIVKTVIAFILLLTSVLFMVWFERKAISDLQNRIGPNRAGPFGIFQTVADGLKFFMKEDSLPDRADRRIFILAPYLTAIPAFLVFLVIPIGGDFTGDKRGEITIFGHETLMQLADPPIGVLLILALSGIAVYGIMLAGWSSGSKYPLLGSVRASAQMVSYEAALGLSVVTVVLVSGTLSTNGIVDAQSGSWVPLIDWNLLVTGVVPFIIFLIAATAELNRPPFDLVEAEQELVGGFNTEYSSFRFALFFLAEFMNTVTMSAIIVTLFLGGPNGPVPIGPGWLWGTIWFTVKLFGFLFLFVWFRATLPRVRYDQLMMLGWKVLIPLALGWFLLLTAFRVGDDEGWNPFVIAGCAVVVFAAGYGLLAAGMWAARRNRALEGEVGI